ncbi:hypothetical protein CN495_08695 [Bacillus thuringiensis]|uniref:Uncharacterized protein n=1 Tax=Bacillus thuringiensis TaxID=1428 RepID=A0ABD6SH21_BACTU|nr:hypothetical protein [Bacillus thuringiensis]PER55819.1 hypothetical protein CN495_08695 [Bacillus thuringiensis]
MIELKGNGQIQEQEGKKKRQKLSAKIAQVVFMGIAVLPVGYVVYAYYGETIKDVSINTTSKITESVNSALDSLLDKDKENRKEIEEKQKNAPKTDIIPSLDTKTP